MYEAEKLSSKTLYFIMSIHFTYIIKKYEIMSQKVTVE